MENSKGENNMKTNTKKLLTIFLASALALMLSIATLFTLPTFSASAAEQKSMTFNDVIKKTEIEDFGILNGNNYYRAHYKEGTQSVAFQNGAWILTYMDGVWLLTNDGANVNITNMEVFNAISYGSYVDFYLPYIASVTNNECNLTGFCRAGQDNGVYQLSLKDYTVKETAEADVITNTLIRVRRADGQALYTEGDNFYFDGLKSQGRTEEGRLLISVRDNKVCINDYSKDTVVALHRFEDNFMTYVDFYINSEHYVDNGLFSNYSFNGVEYIVEELFIDVEETDTDNGAEDEMSPSVDVEEKDFWETIKDKVNGWGDKGSEWLGDNLGVTISGSALIGAAIVAAILIVLFRRRK